MTGYEIHNGRTTVNGEPFCRPADGTPDGCIGPNVFSTYLHGLFDSGELTQALDMGAVYRAMGMKKAGL